MISTQSIFLLTHILGLILGVGAATIKMALLIKYRNDSKFLSAHKDIIKIITRFIISGLILLTLSGIARLILGYPFTPKLILKISLIVVIWLLGPIIDNVIEPKLKSLSDSPNTSSTPALLLVQKQYLALEFTATGLFYFIVFIWILG